MPRRISKVVKSESREIDYWRKLSEKEAKYLKQFLLEYYQGDFNHKDVIHPEELEKDCYRRNNESKRQWHSVGSGLKELATEEAYAKASSGHYTPKDYAPDSLESDLENLWDDGLDGYLNIWKKSLKNKKLE